MHVHTIKYASVGKRKHQKAAQPHPRIYSIKSDSFLVDHMHLLINSSVASTINQARTGQPAAT